MGFKVGGTTIIDNSGEISANVGNIDGRDIAADGAKLDGIAAGATNVTNTNQLTNGAGFITGITSGNVTTALGFTPYGPDATAQFDTVELGDTSGPILSKERDRNMRVTGSSGVDCGITGLASNGSFSFQIYGSGGTQGFLTSNWGGWGAYVDTSGNWTATGNVTAYSDETLKDNIVTIENPLEKLNAIRGVTYNRNDIEGNPRHTGVIAQEVEKVLPEVVQTSDEGIKTVAYGNMVGLLIEAIKELKQEIEELKNGSTD